MTLISEDYRSQQEQMHTKEYGGTQSNTLWPMIAQTLADYGAVDVLDYGAGKGHLGINLSRKTRRRRDRRECNHPASRS